MTTADEKDSCNVADAATRVSCEVYDKLYPEDNGKLSKYFCGCVGAFIKADPSLCHADEYDFPDSPRCGALFKSKEFPGIVKKGDNLINKYTLMIFKDEVKICTEKDEKKLIKGASLLYVPGLSSRVRTLMFENAFPCQTATDLLVGCHMDFLELAANKTIN